MTAAAVLRDAIAAEVARCAAYYALIVQPKEISTDTLLIGDGTEVMRDLIFHDFPAATDAIIAGAGVIVHAIRHKHGAGRVWCLGSLVHIVEDDGMYIFDGKVRLRSMYAHERTARIAWQRPEVPR